MPSPVEALRRQEHASHVSLATNAGQHHTPVKIQTFSSRNDEFKTPSSNFKPHHEYSHQPSPYSSTPSRGSRSGSFLATPGQASTLKLMQKIYTTPGGTNHPVVLNPFENQLLDKFISNSPMFSPNMFRVMEPGSAEKSPETFRWSIDQLAILKPVKLDEAPLQQDTLNIMRDPHEEARIQATLDHYFQTGNIAPSPWTRPTQRRHSLHQPGEYTSNENLRSHQLQSHSEAQCQTTLTLPVDFDLQKVLGTHYTFTTHEAHCHHAQQEEEEEGEECPNSAQRAATAAMMSEAAAAVAALFRQDSADGEADAGGEGSSGGGAGVADLSISSLRRKLFFHEDEGTPLSPVRSNKSRVGELMDVSSPAVSPVRSRRQQLSPAPTPVSSHFSSSPIRGAEHTPSLRRCSTAPSLSESPQISPIVDGALGGRMVEGTPNMHLMSPGFSPIHSKRQGAAGCDASYLNSPPLLLGSESGRPSRSDSLRRKALASQTDSTPSDRHMSPWCLELQGSPVPLSPIPLQGTPRSTSRAAQDAKCRINLDIHHQIMSGEDKPFGNFAGEHTQDMDISANFQHVPAVSSDKNGGVSGQTEPRDDMWNQDDEGYMGDEQTHEGSFSEGLDNGPNPLNTFSGAFREFREPHEEASEITSGMQTMMYQTLSVGQGQDTGYQTQFSAEATMSTNLTNQFSHLPSALSSGAQDSNDSVTRDLRTSLDEMSDMYERISRSISEVAHPGGEEENRYPLSSTMFSPQRNSQANKSMKQVFDELQRFADKFSHSNFEDKLKASSITDSGKHNLILHKSCSIGDFNRIGALKKNLLSSKPSDTQGTKALCDFIEEEEAYSSLPANLCEQTRATTEAQKMHVQSEQHESLGSIPTFQKHMPLLSLSDESGERFAPTTNPQLLDSHALKISGLSSGRPAYTNAAFTIETLIKPDANKNVIHRRQSSFELGDTWSSKQAERAPGTKQSGIERAGLIRPRLLFVAEEPRECSTVEEEYHRNPTPGDAASGVLDASPVSWRSTEHKALVNAKRVLVDQYADTMARTKRRSPTNDVLSPVKYYEVD